METSLRTLRFAAAALSVSFAAASPAATQVSVGIAVPGASIGIQTPGYPAFVQVPSYPVYYAPRLQTNLFFYDGLYWVYQQDDWYASSWYDGPWRAVAPQAVPLYVLRVPVRYYRNPPGHFRGWRPDAPPHWDEHWGPQWSRERSGWDRWDRRAMPAAAPLPSYQRRYAGERYPRPDEQDRLHDRNYRYQPRDPIVREQMGPGQGNGRGRGRDKDRDKDDDRGKGHRN